MQRLKRKPCFGIRREREAAGLTQARLAARAGCSIVAVAQAEAMESATPELATKLASAIGCPLERLIEG